MINSEKITSSVDQVRVTGQLPQILIPSTLEEISLLTRKDTLHTFTDRYSTASIEQDKLDQYMTAFRSQKRSTERFERSDYDAVRAFFDDAYKDYDSDMQNPFFSFSHDLLKYILTTYINLHFRNGQKINMFDAGAGTGNWSEFVLGLNEGIRGTLFDMNPNMLKVARRKLGDIRNKTISIIEGDLEKSEDYPQEKSNLILCLHNVIGLGRNTSKILANLQNHLTDGGLAFIMTPNKYQAFSFTLRYRGESEALRVVLDGSVRYRDNMPEMFCYTPQELNDLLITAHFSDITVLGFPTTIQPVYGDEQLLQTNTTNQLLKDPHLRARLLKFEKMLCLNPKLAYRGGSNLIAICKKTDSSR